MNCEKPTLAFQDLSITRANGAHPLTFIGPVDPFSPFPENDDPNIKYLKIPCGKCLLCRKRRAQEIAIRALFEIKSFDPQQLHSFVTLTVDDEHMEEIFPSKVVTRHDVNGNFLDKVSWPRLDHRPFQLFMKRLRKRGVECRFLMCGEYGEKTHRPHFHAVLFGWFPGDSFFDDLGCFHGSKLLEEVWPFGHVAVERVNENRVFYVSGYTLKGNSIKQPEWTPYVKWSRMPGLGAKYIDEFAWKIMVKKDLQWQQDHKMETWYYRTFVNRSEVRFGSRYFDSRLALQNQKRFDIIKSSRLSRLQFETQKLESSEELRAFAEMNLENRVKSLTFRLARKSRELVS